MNAEMNFKRNQINLACEQSECSEDIMSEMQRAGVVSDKCSCSLYSMFAVAGGVLFAIGTVIYSLITM